MIKATYDQIVERIANSSGVDKEEIMRKVEAKRAKLSGLISKEGAAQVVAAELGISFDRQKLKLNELLDGMKKISLTAKILDIGNIRTYKRADKDNKVCNIFVADETGNARVVIWEAGIINKIEKGEIKKGDVVEISLASVRSNEVHLVSGSDIKLSKEKLDKVIVEEMVHEINLIEVSANDKFKVRAYIVQAFEPRNFPICPECGSKAMRDESGYKCSKHGAVVPNYRQIMSIVIDDGTENMRAVLFSENILKLFGVGEIDKLLDSKIFIEKKEEILGKEIWFTGQSRINKFYDRLEIFISDLKEVDVEKLIEIYEKGV